MKKFVFDLDSIKSMGGAEYARSEAWDISNASQAINLIASMAMNEVSEPDDIQSLGNIIVALMEFINGEIKEMIAAARRGKQEEAEAASYRSTDLEKKDATAPSETIPAQVRDAETLTLDLSYVKSLGVKVTEKDLAVKYVAKDTIRHPVFLWGNSDLTDLENEYFTKETDFWDSALGKSPRPLTWDHAQDPEFMANPLIGKSVEWEDNEIGRFAISVLEKGHKYRRAIDSLIERKSLGSAAIAFPVVGASSDSAPQYVQRVKTGKSIWLSVWPWFATALTPTPCEPRMIEASNQTEFIKSLGLVKPDTETWTHEMAILDYYKFNYS